MTLLLGPPGAGKTTLLRTLAGQMGDNKAVQFTGQVTYNGKTPGDDFVVERAAAYVEQLDQHEANMTVAETLYFASEMLGPGLSKALHSVITEREKELGVKPDADLEAMWTATFQVCAEEEEEEGKRGLVVVPHGKGPTVHGAAIDWTPAHHRWHSTPCVAGQAPEHLGQPVLAPAGPGARDGHGGGRPAAQGHLGRPAAPRHVGRAGGRAGAVHVPGRDQHRARQRRHVPDLRGFAQPVQAHERECAALAGWWVARD